MCWMSCAISLQAGYERNSRAIQFGSAQRAEEEAARTYAAYHVTEHGQEWYFKTSPGEELLYCRKSCAVIFTQGNGVAPDKFIGMFFGGQPITAKEFDAPQPFCMENTERCAVCSMNFDGREFSAVHIMMLGRPRQCVMYRWRFITPSGRSSHRVMM